MRDLIELATSVSNELPPMKQREEICNLLLQELKILKGRDLAPYLSEIVFDAIEPGTRVVLKFPVGAHIFDPFISEFENKGVQRNNTNS